MNSGGHAPPDERSGLDHWVEYIQTLHPRTIDLTLERVAQVWARFRPAQLPVVIAVAGTNGKGSSVAMLESVYRRAGYRTGAFTSPHLVRFNERIRLDNHPVDDELLLQSFNKIEVVRGDISLTFFEYNTLLALDILCAAGRDVILLEVGLGGRLDAVNVVDNDLALITAISIDHTAWLGHDREQIGREKAGIIKPCKGVVLADPDIPHSVLERATEQRATIAQAGKDFRIGECAQAENKRTGATGEEDIPGALIRPRERCFLSGSAPLSGFDGLALGAELGHVHDNMAGVVAVAAMLQDRLPVDRAQLSAGLAGYSISGRQQLIDGEPRLLLDVSHNEASVLSMLAFIDSLQVAGRILAVFGALADKDYGSAYAQLRQRVAAWYLSGLEGERGQSAQALAQGLFEGNSKLHPRENVYLFSNPRDAFIRAKEDAMAGDLIVIFGSFHLVGGILPLVDF